MNNSLHLARNCLRTLSVPRCEQKLEEQIMSKDKCSEHFFAPDGGYCVYNPQIFFATRAVLKIGEYHSEIFDRL